MLCDLTYPVGLSTLAPISPVGQVRNRGRAWRFVKVRQWFVAMQVRNSISCPKLSLLDHVASMIMEPREG